MLSAFAEVSIEQGDDSARALQLPLFAIAEKFVKYYWRHAIPYTTATGEAISKQNTGQPAKIISLVAEDRREHGFGMYGL
ncbi:MAG: hypothetical protein ACJ746_09920 [Bryobacteraceae bacterium]